MNFVQREHLFQIEEGLGWLFLKTKKSMHTTEAYKEHATEKKISGRVNSYYRAIAS
jgi:hypothetical protein